MAFLKIHVEDSNPYFLATQQQRRRNLDDVGWITG
jgi:hypothetical protein